MANYQVVDADQLAINLTNIANAIRAKSGSSKLLAFPTGFIDMVNSISQGATPNLGELVLNSSETSEIVLASENGYDGYSKVTKNPVSSNYIGSAITRKAAASYTPTNATQTISAGQYLTGDQTINPIPSNYIDSSDATADVYDIYNGKTAYVNGKLVTGAYSCAREQLNSGSSGCSTSQLVMSCPFKPSFIMVQFNSGIYAENMVICCWGASNAIVYHSYGSISTVHNKIELDRTQITSNVSNYWYYSNGNIYVNRPNSTYSWTNNNYWVWAFK